MSRRTGTQYVGPSYINKTLALLETRTHSYTLRPREDNPIPLRRNLLRLILNTRLKRHAEDVLRVYSDGFGWIPVLGHLRPTRPLPRISIQTPLGQEQGPGTSLATKEIYSGKIKRSLFIYAYVNQISHQVQTPRHSWPRM